MNEDLNEITRRDDGEKVAGSTWYVVATPHDGIMLTRAPAVHLGDEILSKHRKESAAESAARDARRMRRAVYEVKSPRVETRKASGAN